MRGNLFDLSLLSVLILFFGLLQVHRPQRMYRLWLCAWVMVLCSFLTYALDQSAILSPAVQECLRTDFLVLGGLIFLGSLVRQKLAADRLARHIALLAAGPCIVLNAMTVGVTRLWSLMIVAVAGELLAIWAAKEILQSRRARLLLQWQCVAGAVALVVSISVNQVSLAFSVVLAQIFGACALLLLLSPRRSRTRIGTWASIIGFLCWALLYMVHEFVAPSQNFAYLLAQVWNIPKYLVGFGMILTVVENDTDQITALSEEYRLLYESNPHPMWIFSPQSARFLSINDAAVQEYGYTREEFLEMTLFDIRPDEDHARLLRELGEVKADRQIWRHRRKNGELFDVEVSGHDVSFRGQRARFVIVMDITAREQLNRELVYNAQHDVLTGLANRMLLEERAQQSLARSARDGARTAILTIDVDRFKQINDTYGHIVGDECLKALAERLSSRVRDADTLARTGGEEFTALIGGLASLRGAQAAAASLLSTLEAPLTLSTNELKVTVSIGIAVYPDDGYDYEMIRNRSDKALYQAKRLGGGRAVLASEEHGIEAQSAVDIEAALRDALHTGDLTLAYQPIFDTHGRLARVEALVRGTEECLTKAGPAGFIPVAEESGLILPLGRWVLEEACRQMAVWRRQNMPIFELSVNVSARQFIQDDFTEQVLETLDRYGIAPGLLHLELTETTLMRDLSAMVRSMRQLSRAGVLFSIDDFGTGYSSLARLSDLPISTLKIDRSFVVKLLENEASAGIVSAIVHMSRHLHLQVVAEGVEQPEHIAMLLELGCDMFQGFYLSRPVSPCEIEEALAMGHLGFDPGSMRAFAETAA